MVSRVNGRGALHVHRFNSKAEKFPTDDFLLCIADIIHRTDPFHLILRFQLLRNPLLLCHLSYQQVEHLVGLPVDLIEVVHQLPGGQQRGVGSPAVFLEILEPILLKRPYVAGSSSGKAKSGR